MYTYGRRYGYALLIIISLMYCNFHVSLGEGTSIIPNRVYYKPQTQCFKNKWARKYKTHPHFLRNLF